MKQLCLFLFFAVTASCVSAQKNDHTISFDGIGELKRGITKAELEKLLKTKMVLKEIGVDAMAETIQAKYRGKDVELQLFERQDKLVVLEGVRVTDPVFRTADGIGIGTEQSTIVNKYENHLLIIDPVYSENKQEYTTTIKLANINNYKAAIIFSMVNKKVVAINVGPTPEFRDSE